MHRKPETSEYRKREGGKAGTVRSGLTMLGNIGRLLSRGVALVAIVAALTGLAAPAGAAPVESSTIAQSSSSLDWHCTQYQGLLCIRFIRNGQTFYRIQMMWAKQEGPVVNARMQVFRDDGSYLNYRQQYVGPGDTFFAEWNIEFRYPTCWTGLLMVQQPDLSWPVVARTPRLCPERI